jgi:hypothetical protein
LRLTTALAGLYFDQGEYVKAEPLFMRAVSTRRRKLGEENSDTLASMNDLGLLYLDEAKYAKAEPLFTTPLNQIPFFYGQPVSLSASNSASAFTRCCNDRPKRSSFATKTISN